MHRFICVFTLLAASTMCLIPVLGEAPQKVAEIATADDLIAEISAKLDLLGQQHANAEAFARVTETKDVNQAAGVVAVMAQGLIEHPDGAKATFKPANVRDAALAVRATKSFDDSAKAVGVLKEAVAGKSAGDAKPDHPWNKLTGQGRMMKEIDVRSGQIRRALRRLSKPDETARDCSVLAVLALAMEADTHEVKDQAQLPLWKELSVTYRTEMTNMSKAVRAKDTAKATEHFTAANNACNKCHEQIRDKDK